MSYLYLKAAHDFLRLITRSRSGSEFRTFPVRMALHSFHKVLMARLNHKQRKAFPISNTTHPRRRPQKSFFPEPLPFAQGPDLLLSTCPGAHRQQGHRRLPHFHGSPNPLLQVPLNSSEQL